MNIEVIQYNQNLKIIWDSFVTNSKNGVFLFYRDYMEYHSDRFTDNSLLFYLKGHLIALLPANKYEDQLCSHNGLTFGGLIFSNYTKITHVVSIFQKILEYLKMTGLRSFLYKPSPYIYHKQPSQEDLYGLFLNHAYLQERSVSSCLYLNEIPELSELRERKIKTSLRYNLEYKEDTNFEAFWVVLEKNLKDRYGTRPVHALSEILYLKSKFSANIKLYNIYYDSNVIGGCLVYYSLKVAHLQYIASNEFAKKIGAIDGLFSYIITLLYNKGLILDFGTSMSDDHQTINNGLIYQKEGFGARTIVYDTYLLTIDN